MVEEQAYVEEQGIGFAAFFGSLKRYKLLALSVSGGVFIVGAVLVFAWPASYRSTATILLEEPEVPPGLVQTTVTTFAAEQIQYINQRVMTRTNLAQIIEKFDLYKDKRRYTPNLLLTDQVKENMTLDLINVELTDPTIGRPILKAIAFTIGFQDRRPEVAQQVANELVSLYLEENVRVRTLQTGETRQFLTGEVERLDEQVKEIEAEIARFKEQNEESLPSMMAVNMQMSQRTDDQLTEIRRRLNQIEDTRILLDVQLDQIKPTSPMTLPDGRVVVSAQDQLKAMQTRLAMLRGRYSPDHPDVLRTQREVEALKVATGLTADYSATNALLRDARTDLVKTRETYGPEHPEVKRLERLVDSLVNQVKDNRASNDALVKPDNPAYIKLVASKELLKLDAEAARAEEQTLRNRLLEYEKRMMQAPRVEQELQAMLRTLQSATSRYFSTRERQFGAEMGEALEIQSKGERFVLVEPPDLPLEPSTPNRVALIFLLIILAPAAGIGVVLVRMALSPAIWGSKMLDAILGGPPIAEIPIITTHAEQLHSRRMRFAALAGVPAAALLLAVIIHYALRPLDVLWFVVLRNLGI